jgi:HEPN domain-containing protein
MNAPESDPVEERRKEAARWLLVATDDAGVARLCLDAYEPKIGAAAYHCQQSVEKMMKGPLVPANVPFPRTHDLRTIGQNAALYYPD